MLEWFSVVGSGSFWIAVGAVVSGIFGVFIAVIKFFDSKRSKNIPHIQRCILNLEALQQHLMTRPSLPAPPENIEELIDFYSALLDRANENLYMYKRHLAELKKGRRLLRGRFSRAIKYNRLVYQELVRINRNEDVGGEFIKFLGSRVFRRSVKVFVVTETLFVETVDKNIIYWSNLHA